jgi:hypothetical protein
MPNRNQNSAILTLLISLGFLLNSGSVNSQVDYQRFTPEEMNWSEYNLTGWRFGINMGLYFANKSTAQYYSGMPQNENNLAWVLNTPHFYYQIEQELNSRKIVLKDIPTAWTGEYNAWRVDYNIPAGDTTWWIYYPTNLKYDAAISPGFYAKYNFNNTTGVFIQSNYVKLTTSGIFQMVIDSITGFSEPALRPGYIKGVEERVNIDVGISKFYRTGQLTSVFIETGFHLNSTRVIENRVQIGQREFSIVDRYLGQTYVPNSNIIEYNVYQGGLGFGIFLNGGVKFILGENISIDPGVQLFWKKINLEGHDDFGLNYYTYIRMIFNLFGEM